MKSAVNFSLLLLLAMASCDPQRIEDVNQDRVETNYSATYDSEENEVETIAYFRFGNTRLRLNSQSQILVENKTMKEKDFLGLVDYQLTLKGFYDTLTFYYTDLDERLFVNKVGIPSEIQIGSLDGQYAISEEIEIPFTGNKLGPDERIIVYITTSNNDSFSHSHDDMESRVIKIPVNSMGPEFVGNVTISLKRYIDYDLQEYPHDGWMYGEYLSKQERVRLTN